MMKIPEVSLLIKLQQVEGLIDTNQISDWENKFLSSLVPGAIERAKKGQVFTLTPKQLQVLNGLWSKHFAG